MERKKVLIIDDEEASRTIIRQYLEDYRQIEVIGECINGIEAVSAIDKLKPDLIFLDIQIPGLSGFQVIRNIVHVPQIIFSTAFDRYALKAFDSNAIDYLLKPYTKERFNQALLKVLSKDQPSANLYHLSESGETSYYELILLKTEDKMISVPVRDIIYFEADTEHTKVITSDKTYLSNFGISILEQRLDPALFLRIHRSHIINLNHLHEVHKENGDIYVVLKNQLILRVGSVYTNNIGKLMY